MMQMQQVVRMIQVMIGVNFFWFGMLKFFPGVSPAEDLAVMTVDRLTFDLIAPVLSMKLLAIWEVAVGIGFLLGRYVRFFVPLFMLHMALTFTPLLFFPELCFTTAPFAFTLTGQYIVKNLVFIVCGVMIYLADRKPLVAQQPFS
jgi:uncharacterized membrane protein YkgB